MITNDRSELQPSPDMAERVEISFTSNVPTETTHRFTKQHTRKEQATAKEKRNLKCLDNGYEILRNRPSPNA